MRLLPTGSAFLFALFISAASDQEELIEQSGEHETFSRIVFPLEEEITWNIEKSDRAVRISFPNLDAILSTEGLLSRLPTGRLDRISADRGVVELQLGCDCEVEVFRFDGRFVVIDVLDEASPTEPTETTST